ncbi:hypothetical protein HHK36_025597 [Tetracentron sinense]|uniref:SAWADEE domain-containing protein n=1 Tax=Tetracentron sinense TaxID=13715 RepID=A0A834YKR8_TETSI|nr:hypothetical protein HHK36_025597 [Tetracentron sinense]
MDRLRPRERRTFSGFTQAEIENMEKLLKEVGEKSLDRKFCQNLTYSFNRSSGRAGKPYLQWKQMQSWFQNKQQDFPAKVTSSPIAPEELVQPDAYVSSIAPESSQMPKGQKVPDLSELEFEARSSKDGAWYDVATFLTHRVLSSGEPEFIGVAADILVYLIAHEVRVRFVGFGAEEDEWVNVKKAVRERSIPLEPSECQRVKTGDLVLCFQEREDQAIYYDAHVVEVQRKLHDIRGCRCLFLVRYDHDNTEESVQLRRLCCRPSY